MKKYNKFIAIVVLLTIITVIIQPVSAKNINTNETVENFSEEQLLQLYKDNRKTIQPQDYSTSVCNDELLDEIKNNPIENILVEDDENKESLQSDNYGLSLMNEASTNSTSFKVDPVNNPFFTAGNNNDESVSLSTGALNYTKTILSMPGRNGLDLNVSINYNSQEATITKNEFDCDRSEIQRINPNSFAIGWSFGFATIIKENDKHLYGYDKGTVLRFANGSEYEIENDDDECVEDLQLSLKNYKLDDISLVRNYERNLYILDYSNGITEYFDTTYGCILKREDKFGNYIEFQYKDIEYFQGSLTDYIFDPNIYTAKLHALNGIIDSVGRIINIEYSISKNYKGTMIDSIKFLVDDNRVATINLVQSESYNGNVIVVRSVVDAERMYTSYEYDEGITHIQNDSSTYSVLGSNFLLKTIIYPAGEKSVYEYTKDRRSFYIPETFEKYWYNVYKVSRVGGHGMQSVNIFTNMI